MSDFANAPLQVFRMFNEDGKALLDAHAANTRRQDCSTAEQLALLMDQFQIGALKLVQVYMLSDVLCVSSESLSEPLACCLPGH